MAIVGAWTTGFLLVNGVDLSDHVRSITTEDTKSAVDVTAMGATNTQTSKGVGDAKITAELFQDFSAGKVHATLQPLIQSTTPVAVEARQSTAARSATNPAHLLTGAFLMSYNGLDGSVNDALVITAEFVNAPGGTGMTYPTA
jgi:hypothetical protein